MVRETIRLTIPEPLIEDAVVVTPTARRSSRNGAAAGMVTLARSITDEPSRKTALASARTCWPVLAVLDATFVHAAGPRRVDSLAMSDDVVELSRFAAELLEVDLSEAPHLLPRRTLPTPVLSRSGSVTGGTDGLMERGYRLYARLTGDLVPPQMLSRGGLE
jgi:hypothetical protein